ncbi:DUF3617 domain-containing protein [Sphingomonas sp. Leaf208]|uniref:DUF3617 domain-containing protein n=1 Tax=Sphingomonas sp. Leaf208 TaxID=1735679 RepID=UPI0009E8648B|nr:DUF3617 family protein [Sphingomonas sp. Leaf208]
MLIYHSLTLVLASMVAAASAQVVVPGRWDVTSTVVELSVPGVPGFLVRMMRGKSKAEHKRVAMGQGIEQLLLPDQKAQCRVESQHVADGRYAQMLSCPQKRGEPLHIVRTGTYDRSGFMGDAIVTGVTPKGAMKIVLKQRAARIGD